MELKYTQDHQIKPVEVNLRVGGGSINELIDCIHGTDLLKTSLHILTSMRTLDRTFVTTVIQPQPGQRGRIVAYEGLSQMAQQPDCIFVSKLVPEGAVLESFDMEVYLVEFCVVGTHEPDVRDKAARYAAQINVIFE